MFSRIILVGDTLGISSLLSCNIDKKKLVCIVGASNRPQYHKSLISIADELQIPFLVQPKISSIDKYKKFLFKILKLQPNLLICNSYSMLIHDDLLQNLNYNAINIHYSLLPKNRGCNPTQWCIIKGENKTGVTIHFMGNNFDNGHIIDQIELEIHADDTWLMVNKKLDMLSKDLLNRNINNIINGHFTVSPQNENEATYNSRLNSDFPLIDFDSMNDLDVYNLIRAQVKPLDGAYIYLGDRCVRFPNKLSIQEVRNLRKQYIIHSNKHKT